MFEFKPYFLQILGERSAVYPWGVNDAWCPYGRMFKSMPSVFTAGWGISSGYRGNETYRKLNGYTYSWYASGKENDCFNIKNLNYWYIVFEDIN